MRRSGPLSRGFSVRGELLNEAGGGRGWRCWPQPWLNQYAIDCTRSIVRMNLAPPSSAGLFFATFGPRVLAALPYGPPFWRW
jgi:hypothetical protein